MRLAILNQFYVPDISPTAHLAFSLAEHRAARGDEITVIAGSCRYVGAQGPNVHLRTMGARVLRLQVPSLGRSRMIGRVTEYAWFFFRAIVRAASLPRQDVVLAMTTPPLIVLAALGHKLFHPRARVLLWCMDCYPEV